MTGSSQPDVRRRIGLACDAVRRLAKIWKNKTISKATKVQVFETMALSISIVLQLGNMGIDSRDKQTAKSFEKGREEEGGERKEMEMLEADHGRYTRGPYQKHGHQSEPRHSRGHSRKARRLQYFDDVVRMDQHRLPYISLYGRVEGNRPKGRPRKRWPDNVLLTAIILVGAPWRLHT